MNETPELTVVIPVYGCAGCLRRLHERLVGALEPLSSAFEIVLVDDRSPDGAWDVMQELARADPRVRIIRLSRNFGQHAAITAGLSRSRGRWTVVMDCDLEEPPEEIPRLYAKAQEGYEIVRAARLGRRHTGFRRAAAPRLSLPVPGDVAHDRIWTLSIISRKVVDAFLSLSERDREYQLMLDWLGFTQATVPFEHGEREDGASAYDLRRLLKVAFDGMYFRTTVLLRLIVLLGFVIARGRWRPRRLRGLRAARRGLAAGLHQPRRAAAGPERLHHHQPRRRRAVRGAHLRSGQGPPALHRRGGSRQARDEEPITPQWR